ncbi:hypothetical protein BDF21DRAFT_465805 [Thamnidium elegans]|nr:hypothetical protein BDF21DRAFT_465805 [Thamnidium elegans]
MRSYIARTQKVENKLQIYTFDVDRSLDERLSILFTELNNIVPAEYKLVFVHLTDEEYIQVAEMKTFGIICRDHIFEL